MNIYHKILILLTFIVTAWVFFIYIQIKDMPKKIDFDIQLDITESCNYTFNFEQYERGAYAIRV
jgi:hypothetical protein